MGNSDLSVLFVILGLGILIVCIVAWCKIFQKAGIHPGKLFIPIYGQYLMYSIPECEGLFAASIVVSGTVKVCELFRSPTRGQARLHSTDPKCSAHTGIRMSLSIPKMDFEWIPESV